MNNDFSEEIYDLLRAELEKVSNPISGEFYEFFKKNKYNTEKCELKGLDADKKYSGFIAVFAALVRLLSDVVYYKEEDFNAQIEYRLEKLNEGVLKLNAVKFKDESDLEDIKFAFVDIFNRDYIDSTLNKERGATNNADRIKVLTEIKDGLSVNSFSRRGINNNVVVIYERAEDILRLIGN
jgi:hypothetical protein